MMMKFGVYAYRSACACMMVRIDVSNAKSHVYIYIYTYMRMCTHRSEAEADVIALTMAEVAASKEDEKLRTAYREAYAMYEAASREVRCMYVCMYV